jgi:DNA-binding GntR family transcriptional regulator
MKGEGRFWKRGSQYFRGSRAIGRDREAKETGGKIREMMYNHELVPGQKLLYQELPGSIL